MDVENAVFELGPTRTGTLKCVHAYFPSRGQVAARPGAKNIPVRRFLRHVLNDPPWRPFTNIKSIKGSSGV